MSDEREYSVFYRHFDLPASFPLIALLGKTWISRSEPIRRIHFHNCLEIGYLFEGEGEFCIDGDIIAVCAPCVTLVPQNVPHFCRASEGSVCYWNWLYVDPVPLLSQLNPQASNALSQYLRGLSAGECVFPAAANPQLHALLRMVLEEMGNALPDRKEVVRQLLGAMFLILMRQRVSDVKRGPINRRMTYIEPAITSIAANYMNEVNIAELAGMCHISVSHFRRLFKQVLGWSPQEYLQIIRLDRACAMLYNCDYSVTEIAASVGYPSPSSLNRQFRRRYHISPSQWRKKIRSEENPVVTAYFNALPPTTMQFFPNEYDGVKRTTQGE